MVLALLVRLSAGVAGCIAEIAHVLERAAGVSARTFVELPANAFSTLGLIRVAFTFAGGLALTFAFAFLLGLLLHLG